MLTRYLKTKSLRFHLFMALALGILFRSFSAYFVFGPQALDDYLNQMLPALRLLRGFVHDLPAYRSPLVVWALEAWLRFGQVLHITATVDLIRWSYWGLGLVSMLALLGAVFYFSSSRNSHADSKAPAESSSIEPSIAGPLAFYLIALHGLLPFISTRALLESMSMPFVTLGFCLLVAHLKRPSSRLLLLSFFSLGLATLIRFQVGILYLYALLILLLFRHWKYFGMSLLASLVILLLQLSFEFFDQRPFFSILLSYLKANQNVSTYGASPWHSTWASWLAIFYFPFSFVLFGSWRALKHHGVILGGVLLFVLAHSLVPHKEERFLYPIVGLSLILMALLWSEAWSKKANRYFFLPIFFVLNTALLFVGSFSNTQLGEIGVPAAMEKRSKKLLYLSHDSLVDEGYMYELFIQPPAQLHKINNIPDFESWTRFAALIPQLDGVVVMTSNKNYFENLSSLAKKGSMGLTCSEVQTMNSITDQWLFQLSPERNYRRRPTWFLFCERKT